MLLCAGSGCCCRLAWTPTRWAATATSCATSSHPKLISLSPSINSVAGWRGRRGAGQLPSAVAAGGAGGASGGHCILSLAAVAWFGWPCNTGCFHGTFANSAAGTEGVRRRHVADAQRTAGQPSRPAWGWQCLRDCSFKLLLGTQHWTVALAMVRKGGHCASCCHGTKVLSGRRIGRQEPIGLLAGLAIPASRLHKQSGRTRG